jgi:mannose-6-phosphate isomerase-like protein (cupin superfamily)
MPYEPLSVRAALDSFEQLWSPRIVATVNDYDVRIAKVKGEYIWHAHDNTDEFFMVLEGQLSIDVRDKDGERTVRLAVNDVFVVPKTVEHRPHSESGASILLFEPSGTVTTGNYKGDIPNHLDSTAGQAV